MHRRNTLTYLLITYLLTLCLCINDLSVAMCIYTQAGEDLSSMSVLLNDIDADANSIKVATRKVGAATALVHTVMSRSVPYRLRGCKNRSASFCGRMFVLKLPLNTN